MISKLLFRMVVLGTVPNLKAALQSFFGIFAWTASSYFAKILESAAVLEK